MRKIFLTSVLAIACTIAFAQKSQTNFDHVEPPFWFLGMKDRSVQILFHNKATNINEHSCEVNYKGVSIKETRKVENPHFLFVTLEISPDAVAGKVPIKFTNGKKSFTYNYELRNKGGLQNRIQGFNPSDVLYLIMPDRFANGDPSNDSVAGMFEAANRSNDGARHGGDLKGITNHLDYIKDLGVTAIWLNPVLENDQKRGSYHGYAVTDLYNVDRRFGGNAAYVDFINRSHEKGLKVIQDMIINHIGSEHWLMNDLPEKDWIHQFPEFTQTNYQGNVLSDPYKSAFDSKKMNDGWFVRSMPDVNQSNELFAKYLLQNTLWWIEYTGIDGIRMDTHPFPDKGYMSYWCRAVLEEYPSFNIVGEVWLDNSIPATAYWQKGARNFDGYESNLPTVTDFPFCFSVPAALNEKEGWNTGLRRLYVLLSQDFIYANANNNLTFLDNHDMTRYFLSVNRDLQKFKLGLVFLLTTRGIPQLYYGTELLMDGDGGHHPNVRKDFPGGWPGDSTNAFTKAGRTAQQNEAFDFMQKLLKWRQQNPVAHNGRITHFIPEKNIYVYFRENDQQTIMVIMNANPTSNTLAMNRFSEKLANAGKVAVDVISGAEIPLEGTIDIPPTTAYILKIR